MALPSETKTTRLCDDYYRLYDYNTSNDNNNDYYYYYYYYYHLYYYYYYYYYYYLFGEVPRVSLGVSLKSNQIATSDCCMPFLREAESCSKENAQSSSS